MSFGCVASLQQDKYQRIQKDATRNATVDWKKLAVVALILVLTIVTNYELDFPAVGVWVAILLGALIVKTPWGELKHAFPGTVFLVSLVTCA